MKSVHSFVSSFDSAPASSTILATFSTSSKVEIAPSSKVAAISFSSRALPSADSTRDSSSLMSPFARSSASMRFFSSASFLSCSLFRCSFSCSMRFRACSTPLSLSSFIRSFCVQQFSSSWLRTSWSSFCNSSKLSGVACLTFWMTLRMASDDFCSKRRFSSMSFFRFTSSSFFLCSSSSLRLMSSKRFFSASALRFSSSTRRFSSSAFLFFASRRC
mmetsp:Transcript_97197/g.274764  ORF Transcript_97197/g.274764 Transcript_97197/m.274764 type:complete len:217 (+) Transcript_97197:793-1443(+)